jgi:DNA-binding NtrC family response regulator
VVLDEIGELPLLLQTRLVRALGRAGDVRVVCTSRRDLAVEMRAGRFHPDLHAALASRRVEVAPLRQRRDDILPLVARFARNCRLTAHVAEALCLHGWPGNVRELEQVLSAALSRAGSSRTLRLEHLPRALSARLDPSRRPAEIDQDEVPTATKATR